MFIRQRHPELYEGVVTGRVARQVIAHKSELLHDAFKNGYITSKFYESAREGLQRSSKGLNATQNIVLKVRSSHLWSHPAG